MGADRAPSNGSAFCCRTCQVGKSEALPDATDQPPRTVEIPRQLGPGDTYEIPSTFFSVTSHTPSRSTTVKAYWAKWD